MEIDTAEQSAIKLRAQQQMSNALVVADQCAVNGTQPVSQLSLVKMPSMSNNAVSSLLLILPQPFLFFQPPLYFQILFMLSPIL